MQATANASAKMRKWESTPDFNNTRGTPRSRSFSARGISRTPSASGASVTVGSSTFGGESPGQRDNTSQRFGQRSGSMDITFGSPHQHQVLALLLSVCCCWVKFSDLNRPFVFFTHYIV